METNDCPHCKLLLANLVDARLVMVQAFRTMALSSYHEAMDYLESTIERLDPVINYYNKNEDGDS